MPAAKVRHTPNSKCAGLHAGASSAEPGQPPGCVAIFEPLGGSAATRAIWKLRIRRSAGPENQLGIPGFQDDSALMQFPQGREEIVCDSFVEVKIRGELEENWSQLLTKRTHRVEELQQSAAGIHQLSRVGNGLGRFDGETEAVRRRRGPTFPRSASVRTVKAGVDLYAAQPACVALKVRKYGALGQRGE